MGFEAKETIKWYEQFDNTNLVIKNNFKDINIKILKDNLPHLLGLHYMYPGNKIPPARLIVEEINTKNIAKSRTNFRCAYCYRHSPSK